MDQTHTKRLASEAIRLHDELDWRLTLLNMGLLHVTGCQDAPGDAHKMMEALGMLAMEVLTIFEQGRKTLEDEAP